MKKLFVMRHADAEVGPNISDFDRMLTDRGIEQVLKVASAVKDLVGGVDVVLSSSAMRAFQTASIFAQYVDVDTNKIRGLKTLYLAGPNEFFYLLAEFQPEINSALLVGHNPTVLYFVNMLLKQPLDRFPKAGLVAMEFSCDSWDKISEQNLTLGVSYFF